MLHFESLAARFCQSISGYPVNARPSLHVAAKLQNLAEIRRFVEEAAVALGIDQAVIPDAVLAMNEAATNVILHGYQGRGGCLDIEVGREGDDLVLRLRDQAPPFDPTTIPSPDLTRLEEEPLPGGLGVYLIRRAVDRMLHPLTPQGGNELILIKKGIADAPDKGQ